MFSPDEIIEPFWAEASGTAQGRDPLAIQNSSVVIYTKLVQGITNVTSRLRYNGFYCWLIQSFLKSSNTNNVLKEQLRYIRRGEFLLANIMVQLYPEQLGVSGSVYAKKYISATIDLAKGADIENKTSEQGLYWKFSGGAFGQYYIGALQSLGLVQYPIDDLKVYALTPEGEKAAEVFEKNINIDHLKIFHSSVVRGNIKSTELNKLQSFGLNNIELKSDENNFYLKKILESDSTINKDFHRANTIKLLLKQLKQTKEGAEKLSLEFLKANYLEHIAITEIEANTATYWYFYEINELAHLSIEYIHGCLLNNLEDHPSPLNLILQNLQEDAVSVLYKLGIKKTDTLESSIPILIKHSQDVYESYDNSFQFYRAGEEPGICIVESIKLLVQTYSNSLKHWPKLQQLAHLPENNFARKGYAVEIIKDFILDKKHLTIEAYIYWMLNEIINIHTFSSYTKSVIGQGLVHNYMIEDGMIWKLRDINIGRTSPRLNNVVQYLIDMHCIERKDGKLFITELGTKMISR